MAKTAKRTTSVQEPVTTEDHPAVVIDEEEFKKALNDPKQKAFAKSAREYWANAPKS